jgi:CubicO group peptidase (beta-lactamase class C family)
MKILNIFFAFFLFSCSKDFTETSASSNQLYFPTINSTTWETKTPESLKWNSAQIQPFYDFLQTNNSRAFILLKDGKIVLEKYWGLDLLGGGFNQNSNWYWASAGKSLTSLLVGIAQTEGIININNKTSTYLGAGWSSLPLAKENLITVKNQLTMTTGLNFNVSDLDCTLPNCLQYYKDAGTHWFYHNAPYTLLEKVVSIASGKTFNNYTDEKIESKIGMSGTWVLSGLNNVYYSKARDMARFGLLVLNKGKWENTIVLNDADYYTSMTTTSQNLNSSYGYLWWLNGKSSIIFPGLPTTYPKSLAENAPSDLFSALGKNGQFIDVIPSKNMVVIRMGDVGLDGSAAAINFHNEMWAKIKAIVQ